MVPPWGLADGSFQGLCPSPRQWPKPHTAPARRHFEKAIETLPHLTRLGQPSPVKGAAVCLCQARALLSSPSCPHWLVSWREGGREGGEEGGSGCPVPWLPLSLPISALPHHAWRSQQSPHRPSPAQPAPQNWTQLQNGASGSRQSAQVNGAGSSGGCLSLVPTPGVGLGRSGCRCSPPT